MLLYIGWWRHLFCKCFLLELIPSTPLNGSLRNFNTWRVSVGNRTLQRDFWVSAPKNLGPKNCLFLTTLQLNGKFEGQYLQRGTWYRQSGNGVGNYEVSPTSSQNSVNFGPLTAKSRTIAFTHPLKSSFAWWQRPSHWPALWHANIYSLYVSFRFLYCNLVDVQFCLLVLVKWLVGKIVSRMTYNVSNGMFIHTLSICCFFLIKINWKWSCLWHGLTYGCFVVSVDEARQMLEPAKILDRNLVFFAINDNANADSIGGSHW